MSLQRNVQQQNELVFNDMLAEAQYYRAEGFPLCVRDYLVSQGIDTDTSVVVKSYPGVMFECCFGLGGLLLTADHRFIEFEVQLNEASTEVVFVHKFTDVTAQQNMSATNKATGKGFGALTLDVLRAMADA